MAEYYVHPEAQVDSSAALHPGVQVHRNSRIFSGAVLLDDVFIDANSVVANYARLERRVHVGPDVHIGEMALILADAVICPNPVQSASSDGRKLESEVSVGRGVHLHDEVELGQFAIVPTQDTIAHIGAFGRKGRVITVYGSDDGPLYSLGCNIGLSFHGIKANILHNYVEPGHHTTVASAGSYVPWLPVFNLMGATVQKAYDREAGIVDELKDMRIRLIPGSTLR
jgi:carbonic anhydrase/acetyltransferase-like protein (isoleucine patch superfamily)